MSKVWPWHSVEQGAPIVHHANSACAEGNNIARENRREGIGGRPLCERCERLNKEERAVRDSLTGKKFGRSE